MASYVYKEMNESGRDEKKRKQEFHLKNKIISGHFFSGIIAINDRASVE